MYVAERAAWTNAPTTRMLPLAADSGPAESDVAALTLSAESSAS